MSKQIKIQSTERGKNIFMIDPRNIDVIEGHNGRIKFDRAELDELKASIRENGVIHPVEVKKVRGSEKYNLISGERRWRMCMELIDEGVQIRMPAQTFEGNDVDAIVHMLLENDSVPLSFIEEANIIKRLYAMKLTDKEIIAKTGRKKAYLLSLQRINTAPENVKELIQSGMISHTLVLEKINDESVDVDLAFKEIAKIAESNKAAGGTKIKKVTKSKLDAKLGKTDSFAALKAIVKQMEKRKLLGDVATDCLADFAKKIVNNKVSFEKLEEMFFEK